MSRLVPSTALLLAAVLAMEARGAETSIAGVEIGLAGSYRAGEWTPLTVRLGGGSSSPVAVETVTADPEGGAVVRVGSPLPGDGSRELRGVFQSGRLGSDVTVRLRDASGGLLAERRYRYGTAALTEALPKGATLWATAGFEPEGEDGGTASPAVPEGVTAARLGSGLPNDRLAYSAANLLFVRGDLAATPEEAAAIRDWVAGGGHLAIALGGQTEAFRSGPLAAWVPVEVVGEMQLFDLTRIEAYSRSTRRPARARRVPAARLSGAAETLLPDPNGDLIVRSPYGFGRVTVFAFDVDAPPFAEWEGMPAVLGRALGEPDAGKAGPRPAAAAGVTDLSTQLLRAQEATFGVDRPTTGRALILLLVFAAIVGPLDYLIVHRLLRRPALTWVTFPLIVLAAAVWLDRSAVAANGEASRVAQFDLFDVDGESGTLRGRTAVTLYPADSTRAALAVGPGALTAASSEASPPARHLAWAAPAEDTFGGTFREASGGLFRSEYLLPPAGATAEAEGLPLLGGASRHFAATWQSGGAGGSVESRLTARGRGILQGEVAHRLPGVVTDYVVAFGDRIYVPREAEWHPGEVIELGSAAFVRQDLGSFLTRAQTKEVERKPGEGGETFLVTEGTYDPLSTDLDDIVRMLTLHAAAGGRGYTGLTNVARADDDLTPLLRFGRAVVVGRLDAPASDVGVSSESGPAFEVAARTTFVRLVLTPERVETTEPTTLAPTKP